MHYNTQIFQLLSRNLRSKISWQTEKIIDVTKFFDVAAAVMEFPIENFVTVKKFPGVTKFPNGCPEILIKHFVTGRKNSWCYEILDLDFLQAEKILDVTKF